MDSISLHMSVKVPSGLAWSPDGSQLAYQVSGPQGSQVLVCSTADLSTHMLDAGVQPFRLYKDLPQLHWTASQQVIYYAGGGYQIAGLQADQPARFVRTDLLGDLAQLSLDLTHFSCIRDGDIWIAPTTGSGEPQQLTRREGLLAEDSQLFYRLIQRPQWSPDGAWIAYLSAMGKGLKVRIVSTRDGHILNMAPAEDIWGCLILDWAPDSSKIAVSRLSTDFGRKELVVIDLEKRKEQLVWADQDEKWVDHNIHPGSDVSWSGDSTRLAFLSNRTGWRQLYTADLASGQVQQHTQGEFDCYWCGWAPDGRSLAYVSSQADLQQRRLYVTRLDGAEPLLITPLPGVCLGGWYLRQTNLAWSPDSSRIAHIYSGPDQMPNLLITPVDGRQEPQVVYTSRPAGLSEEHIMHLESVRFSGLDGRPIYGVLASSPKLQKDARHPALVFAYGAWDQEAQLGWEFGPKNLIFSYLVNQGYVVLLVDPRGSDGYGREHAHAQYHEGGRKQADDLVAAAQFLGGLAFIDSRRLALFGYSYGGYMVLQTMARSPEVFAAGISMAPVSEWSLFAGYSTYTNLRFGSPDEEPNPLFERSPLYQAHKIQGALLILHGTQDFNVPIISSEMMVSALLRAGKTFEYMAYPGEGHVWVQPATIRDCMLRMERFLNTMMKPQEEE